MKSSKLIVSKPVAAVFWDYIRRHFLSLCKQKLTLPLDTKQCFYCRNPSHIHANGWICYLTWGCLRTTSPCHGLVLYLVASAGNPTRDTADLNHWWIVCMCVCVCVCVCEREHAAFTCEKDWQTGNEGERHRGKQEARPWVLALIQPFLPYRKNTWSQLLDC